MAPVLDLNSTLINIKVSPSFFFFFYVQVLMGLVLTQVQWYLVQGTHQSSGAVV